MTALCLECGARPARLASGICLACYVDGGADLDADYADRTLARQATDAPPGSAAKIAVLAARHAAGEALFHPGDARLDWDGVPLEECVCVRGRQRNAEPTYGPLTNWKERKYRRDAA